ncbi:MAG: hypothetical protein HOB51_09170 [Thaumarchaeota archaeon]|jgi:hypothetical protein|nr:hypothetical protein [Nitrososphaerota archaeon]
MKKFRDFESAREFARKLNLKSRTEWKEYCKLNNKQDDLPRYPEGVYKNKGWKGWGDFLGTGNISPKDKTYRSFESAREFARKLNLKSRTEWELYSKLSDKPDDIPASPSGTYKNKGWTIWGDFLGSGNIKPGDRQSRSFEFAREFARGLNLKGIKEWKEYCRSGNKPDDIPQTPEGTYKNDFKGYGDWLGNGTVASQDMVFRSFSEARNYVRNLKLKNNTEWKAYCRSGNKPYDIPAGPEQTYKKDFKGISDWLGNGNTRMIPVTYEECRKFAQKNNITKSKEWENFSKSGKRPSNIPGHPQDVYKKEWISWGEFLGTDRIANQLIQYRSFTEARAFVQKLGLKNNLDWKKYCNSGNKPDDIPAAPWQVYKEWKKK